MRSSSVSTSAATDFGSPVFVRTPTSATSPNALPFVKGRKAVAFNLNFDYHNQWKVGVGYTTFFGGGNLNMMRDRDILSAMVSYTF